MALIVPKFATETEEADWWYNNRDRVSEEFLLAAKEGRLGRGTMMRRAREAEAKKRAEIVIELEPDDMTKAHAAAARRGMSYGAYIKMLVHEALAREDAA